ncbi:MAG TPA: BBE domain-containing protein [Propionibacteriaceae bacterium]|nr:BBE domain-containing protein [Propionibacteriaceae bacterium]
MVYAGDVEDGQRAVAPFRSLAPPLADLVKPMAYPEIYPPEDPDYHPAAVAQTMFLDHIDLQAAETILGHLQASDASLRVAQLRVLGGAMARTRPEATAFAHRRSAIMANVASFHDGPADKPVRQRWVDQFSAALHQSGDGAYVGFLTDNDPARVRHAYPGSTWDRLVQIKARYDPTNLFHHNHNIPAAINAPRQ